MVATVYLDADHARYIGVTAYDSPQGCAIAILYGLDANGCTDCDTGELIAHDLPISEVVQAIKARLTA